LIHIFRGNGAGKECARGLLGRAKEKDALYAENSGAWEFTVDKWTVGN